MPIRDRKAYIHKHNQDQAYRKGLAYSQKTSKSKGTDNAVANRMSHIMKEKS